MDEVVKGYDRGIRSFDFADANFTFDRTRAMTIFRMIKKEKLNIAFRFKSRSGSIDKELVKTAKEAGAYLISLGMESASQEILDKIRRELVELKTLLGQ